MSALPEERPPTVEPRSGGPSAATMLLGALLIVAGIVWLIDASGIADVSLGLALSVALILVGVALLVTAWTRDQGGLVGLGVFLTVVLTVATIVDVPISGGVGDREHQPDRFADVESEYSLLIGSQRIDFSAVDFPAGETRIEVRQGIGDLEIIVPSDLAVRVEWRLGVGDLQVFDYTETGAGPEGERETPGYDNAPNRLLLDVAIGLGDVEVRVR